MAKAPPPGGRSKDTAAVNVGFDGRTWEFRVSEITPRDVADLRKALGLTVQDVLAAAGEGQIDLDVAAALVFLARRQGVEGRIAFDTATDGLGYDSEITFDVATGDEDVDSPEA